MPAACRGPAGSAGEAGEPETQGSAAQGRPQQEDSKSLSLGWEAEGLVRAPHVGAPVASPANEAGGWEHGGQGPGRMGPGLQLRKQARMLLLAPQRCSFSPANDLPMTVVPPPRGVALGPGCGPLALEGCRRLAILLLGDLISRAAPPLPASQLKRLLPWGPSLVGETKASCHQDLAIHQPLAWTAPQGVWWLSAGGSELGAGTAGAGGAVIRVG